MSIFKNCDIRGIYGDDLFDETAYRLGRALASRHGGQTWLVGGDVRISTPALKHELIRGLTESGGGVLDIGLVPTPAFYFARQYFRLPLGVMVTASHNPAGYNGFKLTLGEMPVTAQDMRELEASVSGGAFVRGNGSVRSEDVLPQYRESLLKDFPQPKRRLSLVVDAGNGCMSLLAPAVLSALGHSVIPLFCEIDGHFPSRDPNPAVASHLTRLAEEVRANGADMGVAFDGDGDRVVFVDENGKVLSGEESFVLFMRGLIHPPASIVYDIKSSSIVKREAERLGARAVMERSGHAFIKRTFLTLGSALAGEISGHFFFPGRADDGLYAAMMMAHLLALESAPLSSRLAGLAYPAATPDLRIKPAPADIPPLFKAFERWASRYRLVTLDGLRAELPSGAWALLRRSVTEPVVTLRLEANDDAALQSLKNELLREIPLLADMHPVLTAN